MLFDFTRVWLDGVAVIGLRGDALQIRSSRAYCWQTRSSAEFEHDWPLASAFIERWRPESHTFHLPCGEMTITLQDLAYQLGLRIDGDLVLGVVPGPDDRQSQTKWTVKLTWFHNTVIGELEQDPSVF
ncbi:hypothetical protein AHAS_Ahas11G0150600 [Arachis hypogaea]